MNSKLLIVLVTICFMSCTNENFEKPNIIIIYADDLGYGDVSAYKKGTLKTPNIDNLANGGLRFNNGYASSATCSPSRYALLTGTYPWRNSRAKIVTGGSLIIGNEELTIPKILKNKGYHTGIVGKWHLGLGSGLLDYNNIIKPGPHEVGFNYSHIMADTQDRVPCVYIENGHVVGLEKNDPIEVNFSMNKNRNNYGLPTGLLNPDLTTMKWHHGHNGSIINGIPRIGFMKGGKKAHWIDIEMADHFLKKSKEFILKNKNKPFFLFYSMQQPHVPRTPHPRFKGKSRMGPRGDAILELDWCVGELYKTLENEGILDNTLIFFSSDNGPVLNDGYYDDAVEKIGDHKPSGGLRGGKYSLFEAGTKVPFIAYWKDKIKPGVSNELISQIDLFNSISSIVGSDKKSLDGIDLSSLILKNEGKGRSELVIEALRRTAYINKNWVIIPPYKGPSISKNVNIELGNSNEYKLYNLSKDPSQKNNLSIKEPEKLKQMISDFIKIRGEKFRD